MKHFTKSARQPGTPSAPTRIPYSLLLISSAAAAFAASANAQEQVADATTSAASALSGSAIETIVVTANKREEKAQDVPVSVTAVSGDQLERDNTVSATDIARYAPNTLAWTTESRARPRWYVRGVGNSNVANNVVSPIGIYVDEVYLNSGAFQGFPLFDLERVEVLRGPQGTLWGKNTTGGAFSFVSKAPTFDTDGYAQATFGDYGQRGLQGAVGGALIGDQLAGRVSFYTESRDGYAKNTVTGDSVGDIQDTAARAQLLWRPSERFEALLSAHLRKFDGQRVPWFPVGANANGSNNFGYVGRAGRSDEVAYNVDSPETVDSEGALLRLNWQISDAVTLTSITGYDDGDRRQINDGDSTPLEISRTYNRIKPTQWSQELRLASNTDSPLEWIAGLYYFDEDLNSYASTATLPNETPSSAAKFFYTTFDQKSESAAAFAHLAYKFTDRFKLGGGLRYTRDQLDIDVLSQQSSTPATFTNQTYWWLASSVSSPLTTYADQSDKTRWSKWTWDVTPEFRITDNALAYVRYSNGYRAGNFQGQVAPPSTPLSVIDPESIDAYEVGLKTDWFSHRLVANVSAFYYDYDDLQVSVVKPLPSGSFAAVLENAASARIQGAEVELRARPIDALRLTANLGYLDAEYRNFTSYLSGVETDLSGNDIARAPHFTGYLAADYLIPLPSGALTLTTDWNYTSHFYISATNQRAGIDLPYLEQKAYWIGNARVSWLAPGDHVEIGAGVQNLLDKEYKTQTLPLQNGQYQYAYGNPRSVYASVRYNF